MKASVPNKEIEEMVEKGSVPDFSFFLMIGVSSIIATLGLLANSAAVIIGAMIIAPLMNPIIAVAYWLLAKRRILIIRSLLTIVLGTILSIVVAYLITQTIGWKLAGSEIVARMTPNLLDLGVAIAAGVAAAFAFTRAEVSNSFAGIAIAVALVPPLCTIGIALAVGRDVSPEVGLIVQSFDPIGPLLLYITNFIGIIFASSMIFFLQYFKGQIRPLLTLFLTLSILVIVALPLGFRMNNLLIRNLIRRNLTVIGTELLPDYSNVRLRNLNVRIGKEVILVNAEAVAPPGAITESFLNETRKRLSEIVNRPVVLQVRVYDVAIMRSAENLPAPIKNKGLP